MPIMRVEKNRNYTVMANYHLKDKEISLKAKGLLSVMLSLPSEWDFTLAGLSYINKEGVDAIRAAVNELVGALEVREAFHVQSALAPAGLKPFSDRKSESDFRLFKEFCDCSVTEQNVYCS